MNFLDDGTDEETCERINWTIIDDDVMNMSCIIREVKYGDIYNDDSSCHGYYIIKFSSSPYSLQVDLIIYEKVVSSVKMVRE